MSAPDTAGTLRFLLPAVDFTREGELKSQGGPGTGNCPLLCPFPCSSEPYREASPFQVLGPQQSRPVGLSPQAVGVLILLGTREGGCCCHLSGGKGRQGKSGHGTSRCQGQAARKSLSAQEQAVWLEKRVCVKAGGWSGLEGSSGAKPCHQTQ